MSWDFDINEDSFNYTYNVSSMFCSCYEDRGIRIIHGLTGEQTIPLLRVLRVYMEDHKAELLELEPDNGWGDYDGALGLVNNLIKASIDNKTYKWDVS